MEINKKIALGAISILAMFTLAACGSSSSKASSAATGSIIFGGDGAQGGFTQADFNPFDSANHRQGVNFMYEPLMVVNSIDGKATPFLATSEKTIDASTIEYTIRKGMKWSDGQPLTVQDVLYTFNLLKKNPALDTNGEWQNISSISTTSDTITFHLSSPNVPAITAIDNQFIIPEHIWKKISNPAKYLNSKPVVSGPYKLGTFNQNQYTLEKNNSYWDAKAIHVGTIKVPAAATTPQAVISAGMDWAYTYVNNVNKTWDKASQGKGKNVHWFPAGGIISLFPNLTKSPLNNLDFRKGLSEALNRDTVAKDAELGYVSSAPQTSLMPGFSQFKNDSIPNGGVVTQNTSAALANFKAAGYTMKNGKLVDSTGKQVSLSIELPSSYSDWLRGAQEIQTEYKAVGINVTLNTPSDATVYNTDMQNGNYDLIMGSVGGTGNVYSDYNAFLNSSFYAPAGKQAANNFERFKDSSTDAALNSLKSATTTAAQKAQVDKLQETVYDQLPVINVFYGGLWGLYSNKNFTGWPSESNPYAGAQTWTNQVLLVVQNLKKN
ncbi:MAG: ABC transporter substrate-binding protein [Streptococcaceae bacterium]|nr:ABC transporter substrate-binding protein [Streptococcaceae bacterium]